MTDKTKEAIVKVLEGFNGFYIHKYYEEALARICAIVDEEKKEEVVLVDGDVISKYVRICGPNFNEIKGKRGQLIFREEVSK